MEAEGKLGETTDEKHATEKPLLLREGAGRESMPRAQRPSPGDPGHTGPSVMPSRGMLGALSAVGRSSFFSDVGTRRLT